MDPREGGGFPWWCQVHTITAAAAAANENSESSLGRAIRVTRGQRFAQGRTRIIKWLMGQLRGGVADGKQGCARDFRAGVARCAFDVGPYSGSLMRESNGFPLPLICRARHVVS